MQRPCRGVVLVPKGLKPGLPPRLDLTINGQRGGWVIPRADIYYECTCSRNQEMAKRYWADATRCHFCWTCMYSPYTHKVACLPEILPCWLHTLTGCSITETLSAGAPRLWQHWSCFPVPQRRGSGTLHAPSVNHTEDGSRRQGPARVHRSQVTLGHLHSRPSHYSWGCRLGIWCLWHCQSARCLVHFLSVCVLVSLSPLCSFSPTFKLIWIGMPCLSLSGPFAGDYFCYSIHWPHSHDTCYFD